MKTKLALTIALTIAPLAALSACGATYNSSVVKSEHGTTNDLPHTILSCVETIGGSVVVDGRVELKVGKDQFGQFDVDVTQKDLVHDYVLGHFLAVERILPNQPGEPDLDFRANQEGKKLGLTLWADPNAAHTSNGKLVLTTAGAIRELEVRCDM